MAETPIETATRTKRIDPHLAIYILRDLPEVQADEMLCDLCWSLHQGYCTESDVDYVLAELRRRYGGGQG